MPYIVNFTDQENKTPITVFDNTSSNDTSLVFPGRNVTGYGQIIAENFLHILENFASANQPVNPVEGQLWYDTTNNVLQLWDNTDWKAASGIQKGVSEPSVETSKVGELWVDTQNQQLRIFTGNRWLLVGPTESSIDGLRYGPSVETIPDSDNISRSILILYIADIPVVIISKDTFSPKNQISGFDLIRAGVNITDPQTEAEIAQFQGGILPKLFGTAQNADALNISGVEIPASRFLRTDVTNTVEFGINVRNNAGVTVGVDGNFAITTSATAAKIYNSNSGSSIDLQTNRNGIPTTILRVVDNRVAINKSSPDQELDVVGNIGLSGSLIVSNTADSISLNTGSIRTAGGVSITKNLSVGATLDVQGIAQFRTVQPFESETYDLGTTAKRWNTVRAVSIEADTIVGTIDGNITGNANTATNLKNVTTFSIAGDVVSAAPVQFDGQIGSYTKIFNTTLTANIIKDKSLPSNDAGFEFARSKPDDQILVYRQTAEIGAESGLLRQTRDLFVGDLGIPLGAILPYAGPNPPDGFLFCDGSEVQRIKFPELYDVIGTRYNGSTPLNGLDTFRLPDLRGRFALGRHNMDNAQEIPTITGAIIDAGGGVPVPSRIEGTEATTLAASSGQSSVTLLQTNLPDHEHNLSVFGRPYSVVRLDTAIVGSTAGAGPTAPGQAQYVQQTGGIKSDLSDPTFGTPISVMNPFLTINYIIRSGPPKFA
jgi:microcystin-dependent protein